MGVLRLKVENEVAVVVEMEGESLMEQRVHEGIFYCCCERENVEMLVRMRTRMRTKRIRTRFAFC
jgi:hypothetical protein